MFRWKRLLHDLDADIDDHIEQDTQDNIARGMSPEEARAAALRKFGSVTRVKEDTRAVYIPDWLDQASQDARYGFRMIRRTPGFTLVAVLTLALGIGANTALFSIVNSLLLRTLPYRDADRLVYISEFWPREPIVPGPPSPDFAEWRAQSRLIEDIAAYGGGGALNLTSDGEPERIQGTMVTARFLDLAGVRPALGRNFTAQEDRPGAAPVVILGAKLWQRRFGASPDVIGKTIELDGRPRTIVGVLPATFVFPDNNFRDDLLTPMALPDDPNWHDEQHFRLLRVMAHLKPNVTPVALRTELAGILRSAASEEPAQFVRMRKDMEVRVTPVRERLSGDIRVLVLLLQGVVGLVLLIGCLNVANLQIARSISRQREMALRTALGAGWSRLARQLLTESLLLSLLGGGAGLLLGYWSLRYAGAFLPANLHLAEVVRIDRTVLFFTLAITVTAGILTGVGPAWASSRTRLNESLKEGSSTTTTARGSHRLHGALVIVEVAMAMVVLAGSGLLVRSFLRMAALDPGFSPDGVLTLRIPLPARKYPTDQSRAQFFSQLLERAENIPGVTQAAVTSGLPLVGSQSLVGTSFEEHPQPLGDRPSIAITTVTSQYFAALKIPVLQGRSFTEADREGSPLVTMVNQAFAGQLFPGQNPIGKRIGFGFGAGRAEWREIVGIVGNVRQEGLQTADSPNIYAPYRQFSLGEMLLVVRAASAPAFLSAAAIKAVRAVDPNQPVYDLATMEQRLGEALSRQRLNMVLMSAFAALALTLATIGIYGVLAYFVSQRSHEIGIRMALGARTGDVLRMVLGRGMALTAAGIVAGFAGTFAATRALQTLLFNTSTTDPVTLTLAPAIFASIAVAACYVPARRATQVDPMVSLRHE